MTDALFSPDRLARDGTERKSVIVVGLPRSGSSLLSQVMSELPGWYVFDDLYLSRAARKVGVFDRQIDDRALDELLHFLGWQIRARKRHGLFAIPAMEEDEVEPMNAALRGIFSGAGADWTDLQEEWLIRLAARRGCAHWGYKSPGAFRHLDRILARYPEMKAVFLMRAPEAVLASYKYMPKTSQDGDPAQYHPISHAIYWRMAAEAFDRARATHGPDRVMLVRFEDMIVDPAATITRLAAFLATEPPADPRLPEGRNSSFSGRERKELTGLERAIVAAVTGRARAALGFAEASCPPRLRPSDLLDLSRTSGQAVVWRSGQAIDRLRHRLIRRA